MCHQKCVRHIAERLVREEDGSDVVEYALLAAFLGLVGFLTLADMRDVVLGTYRRWQDPLSGVPSLWEPPAPLGY
jgi:Flp pilus assembly pilin Flp